MQHSSRVGSCGCPARSYNGRHDAAAFRPPRAAPAPPPSPPPSAGPRAPPAPGAQPAACAAAFRLLAASGSPRARALQQRVRLPREAASAPSARGRPQPRDSERCKGAADGPARLVKGVRRSGGALGGGGGGECRARGAGVRALLSEPSAPSSNAPC